MNKFRPYRPKAIAAANALGRVADKAGVRPSLDPESLIAAARRKTGLQDFDDESFREPLAVLTESIEAEAGLHPLGRFVMRDRLVGLLATRLRVHRLFRDHPEIADEPVEAPLIIAGLQRTGTTMLHRLLAADPDTRALASWEAISPTPPARQKPGKPDQRLKQARIAEKGLKYMAPDFFAIHPVAAEAPEEDVLLLEFALLSPVPEAMMWVPSYAEWLRDRDMTPAYEYLKKLLQLLQWQNPGQRWVLKTPAHLDYLRSLFTVFPDARIIQTHRDPTRTAASFASMMTHGHGVFSDRIDPEAIAAHWHAKNAAMMESALAMREDHPDAFLDVSYYDLIQGPMAEVERIYAFAGIGLTEAGRSAMETTRRANQKDRHGRHSYRLADFGLSQAQVRADYADYLTRFDIPAEGDNA